jgi:hypothetical protein
MRPGSANWLRINTLAALLLAVSSASLAQKDHGLRPGPPSAGAPINGLTPIELSMFQEGLQRAIQLEAVCDDCADLLNGSSIDLTKANLVTQTNSSGLGVRFNGDQCTACHKPRRCGAWASRRGPRILRPQCKHSASTIEPNNRFRQPHGLKLAMVTTGNEVIEAESKDVFSHSTDLASDSYSSPNRGDQEDDTTSAHYCCRNH